MVRNQRASRQGWQAFLNTCSRTFAARPRPKWEEGEGIEKGGQTGGQRSSEKGSEKSSERIIGEIRKAPSVSAQELAQTLGITSRVVEKQLSKLKEKGVIKRIGPDKGGHWEVPG